MKEEKKLNLILGSHAYVPSGARESEFKFAYENKIRPFVSNLYRYSGIQAVLHYSGVLLYWVERNHPEFFMLIEDMVSKKQAEILSGGFYEPCFPLIPPQDRIGQVELMTTYLRRHFGKKPLGCWLPKMAWEQHLVASLYASEMSYTFLSQDQFIKGGLKNEELFFPRMAEDQGKYITVFPVSSQMEKELAEKNFTQSLTDFLDRFNSNYNVSPFGKILCVFPEKIYSFQEESIDAAWKRFFEEIALCESTIETTLPGKILKSIKNLRKVCFPNSSVIENDFSPRQFLIDNDDAGGIYSKMIFVNVLINQLKGDKYRKQNAREELWKAQDSCLFSPGDELYRNELRKSAYSSLLRAEKQSRDKGKFISSLIQYDFDFDRIKEYIFQDAKINCYINLKGACVFELDCLVKDWNYLDCGSDEYGRRRSFSDILLPIDEIISENGVNYENARLCFNEYYEAASQDRKGKSCFKLSSVKDIPFGSIEINKTYTFKRDALLVSYSIINTGKEKQLFQFVPEIDFSFAGTGGEYARFFAADSNGKDVGIDVFFTADNLKIQDVTNEVQITLTSTKSFSGCLVNAYTNNLYQATRIIPAFSLSLEKGETWVNEFSLKFSY